MKDHEGVRPADPSPCSMCRREYFLGFCPGACLECGDRLQALGAGELARRLVEAAGCVSEMAELLQRLVDIDCGPRPSWQNTVTLVQDARNLLSKAHGKGGPWRGDAANARLIAEALAMASLLARLFGPCMSVVDDDPRLYTVSVTLDRGDVEEAREILARLRSKGSSQEGPHEGRGGVS